MHAATTVLNMFVTYIYKVDSYGQLAKFVPMID